MAKSQKRVNQMDLTKIGGLLAAVAPTIATALGGPLAGMATKAISGALFGHNNATFEEIQTALMDANPDQLASLKKIDNDFKVQMKQLDIDLEEISAKDRDSARNMQINTQSPLVPMIATIIIVSFISVVIMTLMGYAKVESVLAGTLIGYLSAKAEQVVAFYFGSSAGSQKKDLMLYNSKPTEN
jgi:Na+/H+ antiporter NhaC